MLPDLGRHAQYVTVRKIILEPNGGTTGWHYHPGPVLAVINSGVLTRIFTDFSVETVTAGDCFVELQGPQHAHNGTNLGPLPVVMHTIFFLSSTDSPLAVDIPAPSRPPHLEK
ncbi:cupin [Streptomyces sp. MT29]|nr:cupin [Streptomyces sp. MT29]